ncbi:arylsulfatase [Haloferula sp.]|uniref:arylsulfatase n=1 Tax=Haloferula sp. TaxID=2497595 RepID=UPI00329DDE23
MKARSLIIATLQSLLMWTGHGRDAERPNILLIVADDLGYSDIGVFGSEIATPNIDKLAAEGMTLTQFHVYPNCGPTRGAMMTGVDSHRAGLGGNHSVVADNQKGKPEYGGHLRPDVVTIAELLRDAGYRTCMTGKWHLGKGDNNPASRGFEKSFALLNGAASHWADQAPIIPGSATRYTRDGKLVEKLPEDFYSSDWYTKQLIADIESTANEDAPFFAFLSFTAPHNPLHVPRKYIEKYRGRFDGGWDKLASQRLTRQRALGLVGADHKASPRPSWVMAWDELSDEQKASRARDMEIYAGMIDFLDERIGRVIKHLKKTGEYDNTLIVFLSDNGPSKTSIADYLAMGGEGAEFFKRFDNSLENKGLPGSSTDIGPGWAYAAATPLRLYKGYVAQGGIQVPAVVKMPGKAAQAGRRSDVVLHVTDLMPTFLSLADTSYPKVYKDKPLPPLMGKSMLAVLRGKPSSTDDPRTLAWSAYGMDASRQGDWKVLRLPEPFGNGGWQLYDLSADPGETNDLAAQFPNRVKELAENWEDYAKANGVIRPDTAKSYDRPIVGQKY